MRRAWLAWACGLAVAVGRPPTLAQPPARAADNTAAGDVREAALKARDGKFADALEQLQRVLDSTPDEPVPVDDRTRRPARWACHAVVASLPADGLAAYRTRAEAGAKRRLDAALKAGDEAGLEALVADAFCTRAAEAAVGELARRAFLRGDFDAAERDWRYLARPASEAARPLEPGELAYPDPKTDAAAVRARLILVQLFRGERTRAADELKAFRAAHPKEAGLLAGADGVYADTLAKLLADPAATRLPPTDDGAGGTTFAGSPRRDGRVRPADVPAYLSDRPTWKTALPINMPPPATKDDAPGPDDSPKSLAFHPLIVGDAAYLADARRVFRLDLLTGKAAVAFDFGTAERVGKLDLRLPTKLDVRYTLTAAGDRLIARFGGQGLRPADADGQKETQTSLVGLKPDGDGLKPAWVLKPPPAADATTRFEGTPAVSGRRMFVALWRLAGGEATSLVACYGDPAGDRPPELLWVREAGKSAFDPTGDGRSRHDLVTLAGPLVVCAGNAGSVLAFEAATGKLAWEHRYPKNPRRPPAKGRDLCPCLAAGGKIFAAPADSDALLCLDAATGRLAWDHDGLDVLHLLGVARGRLICTVGGQVRGIRGFDVRTGSERKPDGWVEHSNGGVETFGRGFVTDDCVFWPTRHGLQFPARGRRRAAPAAAGPVRQPRLRRRRPPRGDGDGIVGLRRRPQGQGGGASATGSAAGRPDGRVPARPGRSRCRRQGDGAEAAAGAGGRRYVRRLHRRRAGGGGGGPANRRDRPGSIGRPGVAAVDAGPRGEEGGDARGVAARPRPPGGGGAGVRR